MDTRFKDLVARCKGSVTLEVNDHRTVYRTVKEWLSSQDDEDVDDDIAQQMIAEDSVVDLRFYPASPVGSYTVLHYDVDAAIKRAHEVLDIEDKLFRRSIAQETEVN